MANATSLVFAGIAPHPPIMVLEVGRDASAEVRQSIDAMAELTRRVIDSGAETVVLISPHAPLEAGAFVAYDGPTIHGDFSMFRAPQVTIEAQLDDELLMEITRAAEDSHLITLRIRRADLDHGTAVPLYFLQHHGWNGRVVALGYSFLSNEDHLRFGNCIKRAIATVRRPVAFIASGDLSHRLRPGAPAGYNPEAHRFDEEVVEAIRSGELNRIANIDQDVRRTAGECGYRSMLVALGVSEGSEPASEVLSYEGPFGVGYLVAQLVGRSSAKRTTGSSPAPTRRDWEQMPTDLSEPAKRAIDAHVEPAADVEGDFVHALPTLARRTIETFITTGAVIDRPNSGSNLLFVRAGCFVSIKTHGGDLRGCIGTLDPVKDTLAEEIIANAIGAATRDPRFPPVRANELQHLKYSVDVLSALEPCTLADLDPKSYGVIVEDEGGSRRGLLLPNLEGINSPTQQVEIASRKAGITPGTPVKLSRFRADRYPE